MNDPSNRINPFLQPVNLLNDDRRSRGARAAAESRADRGRLSHPATSEPAYDADEAEFLRAIDQFKTRQKRRFVTYTEMLRILRNLGWGKEPRFDPPGD